MLREVEKVRSSVDLVNLFFKDLRLYNETNFRTIANADLSQQDAKVYKSFSSVITRYFIFKEKHPELSEAEHNLLYFKLKLDLIAEYFSMYPDTATENLAAFQKELQKYIKHHNEDVREDNHATEIAV